MDWSPLFPAFALEEAPAAGEAPRRISKPVELVDIGCGYGGLLVALAPRMPDTLMLGRCSPSPPSSCFLS